MAADLDALDLKILTHLLRDGRAPAQQVADAVGLSRPAVADRIARLERDGVIRGHTVVVEPKSLGRAVTAFVAARGQTLDAKRKKAFDAILKTDEIVEAHTVAGDDCFFIKVRTDSITSLDELVSKLTAPPLSLVTRTTIVMKTHCEKIGGINLGEK
ncbi:MAG: Lrp/AsnC family transcriptional regulator, leucine-responsive regulatory protein [Thermoanaerobaculia bacterium]|jgi:Lrp/AsnC family leucine-responsive transcriptional regulator|nr:Lrp/AsnC family transcriptional regulator, leucine-responsive regulatory protein [Thermoanaerobaculia bacterium]MEA2416111.1 Lrp/AsnC family transcriptional regulator, leucine-responsive regulatory protein [Thermoanaerobaculia bacterium]